MPFNNPATHISWQPTNQATTLFYGHFWLITNGALGLVLFHDLLTAALASHSRSLLSGFLTLLQKLEAPTRRISPMLSLQLMQSYIWGSLSVYCSTMHLELTLVFVVIVFSLPAQNIPSSHSVPREYYQHCI